MISVGLYCEPAFIIKQQFLGKWDTISTIAKAQDWSVVIKNRKYFAVLDNFSNFGNN